MGRMRKNDSRGPKKSRPDDFYRKRVDDAVTAAMEVITKRQLKQMFQPGDKLAVLKNSEVTVATDGGLASPINFGFSTAEMVLRANPPKPKRKPKPKGKIVETQVDRKIDLGE